MKTTYSLQFRHDLRTCVRNRDDKNVWLIIKDGNFLKVDNRFDTPYEYIKIKTFKTRREAMQTLKRSVSSLSKIQRKTDFFEGPEVNEFK